MYLELAIIAIAIGAYVYHRWIEDQPNSLLADRIIAPRVDPGAAIPIVYGTCRVRSPVLVWGGNFLHPGQGYVRVGDGTSTTADHYSMDSLFVVGIPFYGGSASMVGMWAGDVRLTAPPGGGIQPSTGTAQAFQFGNRPPATSDFSVNGVFYQGTTTQDPNNAGIPSTVNLSSSVFDDGVGYGLSTGYGSALLQNATDRSIVPGYRSQMVAFVHLGIGLSQFIPSISYEVTSLGTGTAADLGQSLPLDACPAAVILDLLTSPWGKLALPIAKIDLPSFQAASLTLFNEGHGYSRSIEQTDDAWTIITDVLRQIDAVLYPEPTTGRFVLKLIRNDYDITKALDVNPSNMQPPKSGWYVVSSYSETLNQVRVTWTDRTANYANNIAIGQDPANVVGQGQKLRALDLHFVGCTNRTLATQLASRELTVVSQPLAKATVVVNRTFYAKRLGDVVTLTWPELGISKMVMRIARIDFGQLHGGSITMDLLRDVFDQTLGAYPVPTTAS